MKLANKIFLTFFWIIIASVLFSVILGSLLISKSVWSGAISRVRVGLKEANSYLNTRLETLKTSNEILINGLEKKVKLPIEPNIVISDTTVISEILTYNGISPTEKELTGFLLIPLKDVIESVPRVSNLPLCPKKNLLCLVAITYNKNPSGSHFKTLLSAVILNGNYKLINKLQKELFYEGFYGKKPFGTVTIFCEDTRINTTVIGPDGKIAVGTRVSEVVKKHVLEENKMWLNRAFVVDDWYISAYQPIKSPAGKNIGILYVGVLEKWYKDIKRNIILSLSLITIPSLFLLLLGVFFLSKGISKPLSALADVSEKIIQGEFSKVPLNIGNTLEIKKLTDSFNKMIKAIHERENKLKEQNIELENTNRDYQELLSFVTHELNNSVGSLLLNVSILTDGTVGELNKDQAEVGALILRDVQRFRDMIRNYLNISRLEKGTLKYHPTDVYLKTQVVKPVVKRFESRLEHRGMKIIWDWDENFMVKCDPELMDICYSNFIVNAIKYGKDWIKITAQKEKDSVVLGVINGGTPIPKDKIPLLFKKFSRLVKSDDGAGLGLYLIKKIVERHNGEVWCEITKDNHTGFFIRLPRTS